MDDLGASGGLTAVGAFDAGKDGAAGAAGTEIAGLAHALAELELAVQRAREGLGRWQADVFCGASGLTATGSEVTLLVLLAEEAEKGRSVKELAQLTNRSDIPNIQYSLRKMAAADLVSKRGAGRTGVTYHLSGAGLELAAALAALRSGLLLPMLQGEPELADGLTAAASVLDRLSGLYAKAARAPVALPHG